MPTVAGTVIPAAAFLKAVAVPAVAALVCADAIGVVVAGAVLDVLRGAVVVRLDAAERLQLLAGVVGKDEPGPLEQVATPVAPENPVPRRVRVVKALFEAASIRASATVRVRAVVDAGGQVAEVRPIGPVLESSDALTSRDAPQISPVLDELRASAVLAVSRWEYAPPAVAPRHAGLAPRRDARARPARLTADSS